LQQKVSWAHLEAGSVLINILKVAENPKLPSCNFWGKNHQLLAHGRWFSPGPPASYTTKTGCHDIAEILLKVALNTNNLKKNQICSCVDIP
jgi:hypothetical protein